MTGPLLRCVLDSPEPKLLANALRRMPWFRPLGLGCCPKRPVSWERALADAGRVELGQGAPDPEGVATAASLVLGDEDWVELWGAIQLGETWVSRLTRPVLVHGDGSQGVELLPKLAPATRAALDLRLDEAPTEAALTLTLKRGPDFTVLELRPAQGISPVDRVARLAALVQALETDDRPFHAAAKVYPAHAALRAAAERLAPHDAELDLGAVWHALVEAAEALTAPPASARLERRVVDDPRSVAALDRLSQDWPRPDRWRAIASLAATPDEAWLDALLTMASPDTAAGLAAAVARRPPWPSNVARLLPFAAQPVGPVGVKARHAFLRWGIAAFGPLQAALRDPGWTAAQASALRKAARGIDEGEPGSELEAPPLTCLELLASDSSWDVQAGLSWLGEMGSPASETTLRAVLDVHARCQDREHELPRAVAVRTLAEIAPQDPQAQQVVLTGLEDPWRPGRLFAIAAATRLDLPPQQLAGAILRCVGADVGYQKELVPAAATALRQLFGPDPSLRSACEASLADEEHVAIRRALAQALEPTP